MPEEEKQLNKELLKEMIECVKREVSYRYMVYKKLVAAGKMSEEKAKKEQKLMYLVQLCLQSIYDGNAPKPVQQSLFDTALYNKHTFRYPD